MSEDLVDELELLASMYSDDEMRVEKTTNCAKITSTLLPSTAGNANMQLSCCILHIHVGESYPAEPPVLELGSSRGLSDTARSNLLACLHKKVQEFEGQPMMCMLLEAGREALTEVNGADSECSICLSALCETMKEKGTVPETGDQVVRLPCYHGFHRSCLMEYCRSEVLREQESTCRAKRLQIGCPECRSEVPWESYPELKTLCKSLTAVGNVCKGYTDTKQDVLDNDIISTRIVEASDENKLSSGESCSQFPEAFVRLHHLWQGNDEKEKPLLRLLKELGLNARVYYGKPALMHIQGSQKDVDAFTGIAKRRHITVTIDVAQKSVGPPIPKGISSISAKKGSLDSSVLSEHLRLRGMGETSFTIIG
jgi:hypothetical protein